MRNHACANEGILQSGRASGRRVQCAQRGAIWEAGACEVAAAGRSRLARGGGHEAERARRLSVQTQQLMGSWVGAARLQRKTCYMRLRVNTAHSERHMLQPWRALLPCHVQARPTEKHAHIKVCTCMHVRMYASAAGWACPPMRGPAGSGPAAAVRCGRPPQKYTQAGLPKECTQNPPPFFSSAGATFEKSTTLTAAALLPGCPLACWPLPGATLMRPTMGHGWLAG